MKTYINTYKGELFEHKIEQYEKGNNIIAEKEFSEIEKLILKEFNASPNMQRELTLFRDEEKNINSIISIHRRYFLSGLEIDEEGVMQPYAAHIATTVNLKDGMSKINVKYNPLLKPKKLLETLKEIYGEPKQIQY